MVCIVSTWRLQLKQPAGPSEPSPLVWIEWRATERAPCSLRGSLWRGDVPFLVRVQQRWRLFVHVGAGADQEEEYEEQRLKIEQRRLSP
jgi:hypothetical protein